MLGFTIFLVFLAFASSAHNYRFNDLSSVVSFLRKHNRKSDHFQRKLSLATWAYQTNLTDVNGDKMSSISLHYSAWQQDQRRFARRFAPLLDIYPDKWSQPPPVRQLSSILTTATSADPRNRKEQLATAQRLQKLWGSAKVCELDDSSRCHGIEPYLSDTMTNSTSWDRLLWAWRGWRDQMRLAKPDLLRLWSLQNEGARENDFPDYGAAILYSDFESTDIDRLVEPAWARLRPLYQLLHAYVRGRLRQTYGEDARFPTDGTIPAHLLGNMWAQEWDTLAPRLIPYPEVQSNDGDPITNFTVKQIFRTAEKFYTSLGLAPMTPTFWSKSMLTKPTDGRNVLCHGSATSMSAPGDFRIRMCTETSLPYYYTAHHEMGHIEYFMAYQHQPTQFRAGANAAFHEAIGDTIQLSVMSEKHMQQIGLKDDDKGDSPDIKHKKAINSLLRMALRKVAFLPFGLIVDKWRWEMYRGSMQPDEMNDRWWEMRRKYQGVSSPDEALPEDFDIASKYHIISGTPYIRYFYSYQIQFQFYRALCAAAGHRGPLHECDFYRSTAAGHKLRRMLEIGSSSPWEEPMEQLTGERTMSPEALLHYFEPLRKWLKKEVRAMGERVGWN